MRPLRAILSTPFGHAANVVLDEITAELRAHNNRMAVSDAERERLSRIDDERDARENWEQADMLERMFPEREEG